MHLWLSCRWSCDFCHPIARQSWDEEYDGTGQHIATLPTGWLHSLYHLPECRTKLKFLIKYFSADQFIIILLPLKASFTLWSTMWMLTLWMLALKYAKLWWCSDGSIKSQECKSFRIYAVTIQIFMTEYHHFTKCQTNGYSNTAANVGKWVW